MKHVTRSRKAKSTKTKTRIRFKSCGSVVVRLGNGETYQLTQSEYLNHTQKAG